MTHGPAHMPSRLPSRATFVLRTETVVCRNLTLFSFALALAAAALGCGHAPANPLTPSADPALPTAKEAPLPEVSTTLSADPLAPAAAPMDHSHHHHGSGDAP